MQVNDIIFYHKKRKKFFESGHISSSENKSLIYRKSKFVFSNGKIHDLEVAILEKFEWIIGGKLRMIDKNFSVSVFFFYVLGNWVPSTAWKLRWKSRNLTTVLLKKNHYSFYWSISVSFNCHLTFYDSTGVYNEIKNNYCSTSINQLISFNIYSIYENKYL